MGSEKLGAWENDFREFLDADSSAPPAVLSDGVVKHVRAELDARGLLHAGDAPAGGDHFFLSDLSDSFAKSARRFFRRSMTVEELRLWDQ